MKKLLVGLLVIGSMSAFAGDTKIKLQTITVSDNHDAKSKCQEYAKTLKMFSNEKITFATKCISQLEGTAYEHYARKVDLHTTAILIAKNKVLKLDSVTVSDANDARSKCEDLAEFLEMLSNEKMALNTTCISGLEGTYFADDARNFFLRAKAIVIK